MGMRKLRAWFKKLSVAGKTGVIIASLFGLSLVGAASSPPPAPTHEQKPPAVQGAQTSAPANTQKSEKPQTEAAPPTTTTQTVTTTEAIAFSAKTVEDTALAKGKSKIVTQGANGVKTLTWTVTYTAGTETKRELVSEKVTTAPITQITAIGTKVTEALNCPNGTYVNSAGSTVCRPYETTDNSVPAGATARCSDGTYSFSQSRRGTCSHHGGVARWL